MATTNGLKEYILNWNQKKILKQVEFLKKKKYDFYLAGGTALALQLGHRTSRDLDFYTQRHFNSNEIIKEFRKIFGKEVTEAGKAPDTVYLKIRQVDLSFFRYPYKLICPLVSGLSINLASLEDIAAMKVEAIVGRGSKRDFVDIYYLIEKYGLKQILKFTQMKYPDTYNEPNCLNGMSYFKDADSLQKDRKRIYIYDNIQWKDIKQGIETEAKKYQMEIIKQ